MNIPPHLIADARAFERYLDAVVELNYQAHLADLIAQDQEAVRDARRSARRIDLLLATPAPRYRRFTLRMTTPEETVITLEDYERRSAQARARYADGDLEVAHMYVDGIAGSLLFAAAKGHDIQDLAKRWLQLDDHIAERWYA